MIIKNLYNCGKLISLSRQGFSITERQKSYFKVMTVLDICPNFFFCAT